MSWLFSQALVEEYSEATSWDGAPSAPLSVMPTQHKFYRNDKTMEPLKLSQFGLTCAVLTEDRGEELLTWFREGFRARTFQQQETDQVSPEQDLAFGEKWRESSARYDLESSSWKTHLCLWEEDLPWSSVILPKWGMTRSGALFQHPTLERPISVIGAGLWPTPNACKASNDVNLKKSGDGRTTPNKLGWAVSARNWPTPVASMSKGSSHGALTRKSGADRSNDRLDHAVMASDGGQLNPEWVEWLMGWPESWTSLESMPIEKFFKWRKEHGSSQKRTNAEGVPSLPGSNDSASMGEREAGQHIQGSQVLQYGMRRAQGDIKEISRKKEGSETCSDDVMQQVPVNAEPSETPLRQRPDEQCSGKHRGAVPSMSYSRAHEGFHMGAWPEEPRISRIAAGVLNRSDRLKALGNGQVPRVAAAAFNILTR